jgi:hypothetical protein
LKSSALRLWSEEGHGSSSVTLATFSTLFRGSRRFESVLSRHARFTSECNKEDTTDRPTDSGRKAGHHCVTIGHSTTFPTRVRHHSSPTHRARHGSFWEHGRGVFGSQGPRKSPERAHPSGNASTPAHKGHKEMRTCSLLPVRPSSSSGVLRTSTSR